MPEIMPDISELRVGAKYQLQGVARDALLASGVTFEGNNALQLLYRRNIDATAPRWFVVDGSGEVTTSNVILEARSEIACLVNEFVDGTKV